MSAYVVFIKRSHGPVRTRRCSQKVGSSFEGRDLKFLATYGALETLEGSPIQGAVILEFPDMEAARAWYGSAEYQAAAAHRFRGARYRGFMIEGREP